MSDSQEITAGDVALEVKGPAPEVWSDDARAERGAERLPEAIAAEGPQFGDDGELVKGPAPEMWDDDARAQRGAELLPEQAAVSPAIPEPWPAEAVEAARPVPADEAASPLAE